MYFLLQVTTAFLACVTFALSLAHALELPGKLRLDKETYCAVQTIYYPGFTVGGFAEVLSVIAAAALLLMTPTQSAAFPWTTYRFPRTSDDACRLVDTHPSREQFLATWPESKRLGRPPLQHQFASGRWERSTGRGRVVAPARSLGIFPCPARAAFPRPACLDCLWPYLSIDRSWDVSCQMIAG